MMDPKGRFLGTWINEIMDAHQHIPAIMYRQVPKVLLPSSVLHPLSPSWDDRREGSSNDIDDRDDYELVTIFDIVASCTNNQAKVAP